MGTDIGMWMESKWVGYADDPSSVTTEQWIEDHCFVAPRAYHFFEFLAGVRGRVENAVFPPRGIPEDSPKYSKFPKQENDGFHGASWLTTQEFKTVLDRYSLLYGGEPAVYSEIQKYMAALEGDGEPYQYRVVFYFNS